MAFGIKVDASGINIDISNVAVEIECSDCGATFKVTLGQIQREETIVCPTCGTSIKLVDKDKSASKGVRQVNQAIENLKRSLGSLSNGRSSRQKRV